MKSKNTILCRHCHHTGPVRGYLVHLAMEHPNVEITLDESLRCVFG